MRKYNPVQGRWLSPDPAGLRAVDPENPQSWNRYAYVGNSPLEAVDPLGLSAENGNDTYGGGIDRMFALLGWRDVATPDFFSSQMDASNQSIDLSFETWVDWNNRQTFGGHYYDLPGHENPVQEGLRQYIAGLPGYRINPQTGALEKTTAEKYSEATGWVSVWSDASDELLTANNQTSVSIYCNSAKGWLPASHCGVVMNNGNGTYTACDGGPSGNWFWSTLTVGCSTNSTAPTSQPTSSSPVNPGQLSCMKTMVTAINAAKLTYNFFWSNSNSAAFAMTAGCGVNLNYPSSAWGAW